MSEDHYLDVVSSILEQGDPNLPPEGEVTDFSGTPQGAHKLDSIPERDEHFSPFRPSKATPLSSHGTRREGERGAARELAISIIKTGKTHIAGTWPCKLREPRLLCLM